MSESQGTAYVPSTFERAAAVVSAIGILVLVGYLIVRNRPFADPNLVVLARTILSLGVAVIGATVPGFLNVTWKGGGLLIRAGGALALFVLTFWLTPNVVPTLKEPEIEPLTNPRKISSFDSRSVASFLRHAVAAELRTGDSELFVRAVYEGDGQAQRKFYDVLLSNRGSKQRLLSFFRVKWLYARGMTASVDQGAAIKPVERYAIPLKIDPGRSNQISEKKIDIYPPLVLPPSNSSGPSVTSVRLEVYYTFEGAGINYHPSGGWDIYYEILVEDDYGDAVTVMSRAWRGGAAEGWPATFKRK